MLLGTNGRGMIVVAGRPIRYMAPGEDRNDADAFSWDTVPAGGGPLPRGVRRVRQGQSGSGNSIRAMRGFGGECGVTLVGEVVTSPVRTRRSVSGTRRAPASPPETSATTRPVSRRESARFVGGSSATPEADSEQYKSC